MNNTPLPIEPYDKEWGIGVSALCAEPSPFARVNAALKWTKERPSSASSERAVIVTECFQKYSSDAVNIKWAKTLKAVLERVTINIWQGELIVGELAAPPNAAPVYPEFVIDWLCDEMINSPLDKRLNDRYEIDDKTKADLLSIQSYWKGKTTSEATVAQYTDEEKLGSHLGAAVLLEDLFIYAGVGHVTADYEKLFRIGWNGIKKEIETLQSGLDLSLPGDILKNEFYTAELIMLSGVTNWILRYAALAEEMAIRENDPVRSKELKRIAENCTRVAGEPPRSFYEAIQLYHFATNLIIIETNGHSVTYGRFDRLFERFHLAEERAFEQELIELFFVKMHQLRKIRDKNAIFFSSGTIMGGTALDVGGVDRSGNDCTNDLSYMVLDAHAHTRIPNPWMGVRLHKNSPREFKIKTFNVIRIGTGEPKIFNDEQMIQSLLNYGRSLEDARDYVGIGCVEPAVPGKTYGVHDSGSVNLAKIMQLAINGGKCIGCSEKCKQYGRCAGAGKTLGPDNGSLRTFTNFDEVKDSYEKQMKYWCDMLVRLINRNDFTHQRLKPLPYLSLLIDGCIDKGQDVSSGGAIYNGSGPQGVGIATAADSFSVIKQLVFDERKIGGGEFLDILNKNWEGSGYLYGLVNSDYCHHYGNDDDYADDLARFVMATYCKYIEHRPTAHGGEFAPGVFSVTNNVMHGSVLSATPDGRVAGEPVSDCIGPAHTQVASHDRSGPTAIANSVAKLDHARIGNGIILNWKFAPVTVAGTDGRDGLIHLMDAYFGRGGMQSQFSVVGRETMLAAQQEPEKYKDLVVRIAGYSAYFVELSSELQADLIGRTELAL
jgi:formate C-acetyltransferase